MLDEGGLRAFLKKQRRSSNAIERCIKFTNEFANYLADYKNGKTLDESNPSDVEDFVAWCEGSDKSAKIILWGMWYYYQFRENIEMQQVIRGLRAGRIKRKPLALKDIRGVELAHADRLAKAGIQDVEKMVQVGRTLDQRLDIAEKTGVPLEVISELVKLSDLSRIPGVKGIRARLYYDAGIETIEKMAQWEAEELRAMLIEFVKRTGFDGIAPWAKEAAFSVEYARRLPIVVEFEA